jgi:endonuclease YncB( thermonuclease family)
MWPILFAAAVVSLEFVVRTAPDDKQSSVAGNQPKVVRIEVPGSFLSPAAKSLKITGKVKVIDAHTLQFEDGTEVELNGGLDAPELEHKGAIDGKLYPAGKDAAEFLRKLIGEKNVTLFVHGKRGNKLRGACFVQETNLETEMVRNGWALSHHEGMEAYEIIARENKRGLWRGTFVAPDKWRKGERLKGEEPPSP